MLLALVNKQKIHFIIYLARTGGRKNPVIGPSMPINLDALEINFKA